MAKAEKSIKTRKKTATADQLEKRTKRTFKNKIIKTFTDAGFLYVPTNDKEMYIGLRKVEVEALVKLFPDKEALLRQYDTTRIKPFALYISKEDISLSDDDLKLFSELTFVQPKTLNYFQWISQCIKHSARNEVFRFLGLKSADIGHVSSTRENTEITAPIIYPRSFTGLNDRVRIVSFMMSAEDLLNTCYVLRKDNWSDSIWLYQRLIEKSKIRGIRSFLESKGEAFYNNIIVALPDRVRFCDEAGDYKSISEIGDLEGNCTLILPKELNSICVIDGQHRIFAHYESGVDSKQERTIAALRKQLHLLVTGLIFPSDMSEEERLRIQSEIFVDINSNAKPVSPNVLLQIKRIQDPIADESLAQLVIERLNKHGVFQDMLQISTLDSGKIKTASIVRFALRHLVTVHPTEGKESLFNYWEGDKSALLAMKNDAIEAYVRYCDATLRSYFGAIKKTFRSQWDDETSKLLSVIAINGFITALTRQLPVNGVQDVAFYENVFSQWDFDFSKENFPYTSSQHRKFSTRILREAFKLDDSRIETL